MKKTNNRLLITGQMPRPYELKAKGISQRKNVVGSDSPTNNEEAQYLAGFFG